MNVYVFISHVWLSSKHTSEQCIPDDLRNLVPPVQFKNREKHPWMSVTFSNKQHSSMGAFKVFKAIIYQCFWNLHDCTLSLKSHRGAGFKLYLQRSWVWRLSSLLFLAIINKITLKIHLHLIQQHKMGQGIEEWT